MLSEISQTQTQILHNPVLHEISNKIIMRYLIKLMEQGTGLWVLGLGEGKQGDAN